MALKGDAKFKGKLTCDLKNDTRNLVNPDATEPDYNRDSVAVG